MPSRDDIPVLILSGSCGAGKTAVGGAVHELLAQRQVPNAFLDVDELTNFWPPAGVFNRELMFESLARLWPLYRKFGAKRVILASVVETREDLEGYRRALKDGDITLIRVMADESTRKSRLGTRESGEALEWHERRTVELEHILERAALEEHRVSNDNRSLGAVAEEILGLWLSDIR